MLAFWLVVLGIIAVVLGLILTPLLKRPKDDGAPIQQQINAEIFRLKLRELEAERDGGAIDSAQFEQARVELERTALTDLNAGPEQEPRQSVRPAWPAAIAVAVLLPAVSVPLYLHYGRSDLLSPPTDAKVLAKLPNHDGWKYAVNQLLQHLREYPGDAKGWGMLGEVYMGLDRFHDAVVAYRRLNSLRPNQPDVLVEYAKALSMDQGGSLKGLPEQLLEQALRLDPKHQEALWLAGYAQFTDNHYAKAVGYWQRQLSLLPKDSKYRPIVKEYIAKAQNQLAALKSAESKTSAAAGPGLKVRVSLDPKLAGRVAPGTTVFVFARAEKGPPMPLAVVRLKVKDLPTTVTLSDSMAMSPAARLSNFHSVMLAARVSPSGQPLAKSGDLQGSVGPVDVGGSGTTNLMIDHVVP